MAIRGRLATACHGGAGGAALAIAVLAWPGLAESQTPARRENQVTLTWQTDWTTTGVAVEPGDTLSIAISTVQPPFRQGYANLREGGVSLGDRLAQAAVLQAFFGRLDENPPFLVGRNFKKVMKKGGLLSLRWGVPREAAGAGMFNAVVRVEPAARDEADPDGNRAATNGNVGADDGNKADANISVAVPDNGVVAVNQAGGNQSGGESANAQGNVAEPTVNTLVVTPPPPPPFLPPAGVDNGAGNGIADGSGTGPSTARIALLAGAIAGLLLVLAGAGLALGQRRGRLRLQRTRGLFRVSPKLDLGEGACRGLDLPAEGPAARFAARLDTGALRWTGGGEDG